MINQFNAPSIQTMRINEIIQILSLLTFPNQLPVQSRTHRVRTCMYMEILRVIAQHTAEMFVFNFKFIAHIHNNNRTPHCFTHKAKRCDCECDWNWEVRKINGIWFNIVCAFFELLRYFSYSGARERQKKQQQHNRIQFIIQYDPNQIQLKSNSFGLNHIKLNRIKLQYESLRLTFFPFP